MPVSSICGGTDICTAFVGASPLLPVRAGEIGGRLLGCAVEAFDPDGRVCPPGVTGELVITAPMPSMPVGFWGDPDGSTYRAAYFDDFPGVWRHGDWVTFTDDGACVVSGRSDATLNRGGVRLGTSELLHRGRGVRRGRRQPRRAPRGRPAPGGLGRADAVRHAAPPVPSSTTSCADGCARRSPPSCRRATCPTSIEAVPAVPRTLSGKKLELPVKRILAGAAAEAVAAQGALADPTALDYFVARALAVR